MLRLQFYNYAITATRTAGDGARRSGSVLHLQSLSFLPSRFHQLCVAKALKDEPDGRSSGFAGQSWDPGLENEVPFEQRPVNEYSSLKNSILYSWGELSPKSFLLRLGGLCLVTFTVLGAPIAAASFSPSKDPLRFTLAAGTGTLLLVSLVVLRIYLGWSYVGDRLLSAVIPYEETGWYDGQMWVKPPELLLQKQRNREKLIEKDFLEREYLLSSFRPRVIFVSKDRCIYGVALVKEFTAVCFLKCRFALTRP